MTFETYPINHKECLLQFLHFLLPNIYRYICLLMYILEDHMILYMRALQALRFCISENYSCNDRLISVSPENEPEY